MEDKGRGYWGYAHLLPDKLEAPLDGALGLELFLLEQHGAHELVYRLAVLKVFEFLHAVSTVLPQSAVLRVPGR